MAQRYVIHGGDTLGAIAQRFYGDPAMSVALARYNGLQNPDLIAAGQTLEIPSRAELNGHRSRDRGEPAGLDAPNGLDEILATFGNIYDYIGDDGALDTRWESEFLTRAQLPFPIPLSWDKSKSVSRLQCHVKLGEIFQATFAEIQRRGFADQITSFGGCFNFRGKRTSAKLSTHSWGIALDLNPEANAQGTVGTISKQVVEVFRQAGFKWGGDWSGRTKDPMHFQFCTGY